MSGLMPSRAKPAQFCPPAGVPYANGPTRDELADLLHSHVEKRGVNILAGLILLRPGFRRPGGQALVAGITTTFERRCVGRADGSAGRQVGRSMGAGKAGTALMTATGGHALQLVRAGTGRRCCWRPC